MQQLNSDLLQDIAKDFSDQSKKKTHSFDDTSIPNKKDNQVLDL